MYISAYVRVYTYVCIHICIHIGEVESISLHQSNSYPLYTLHRVSCKQCISFDGKHINCLNMTSTYSHTYLVMEAHKKRVPLFFGAHNVTQCYSIKHGSGGGLRVTKTQGG